MNTNQFEVSTESNDKKKKKREDRSYNLILKSVSNLESNDEKLDVLAHRYAEVFVDNGFNKEKLTESNRQLTSALKEKDHIQAENNKLVLANFKLETLCRGLQKANKTIKEEAAAVSRANEERRQDVSNTFRTKISEVHSQLEQYHEQNQQLRSNNDSLTNKLKEFIAQFEQHRIQMESVIDNKDAEHQTLQADLSKAQLEIEHLKKTYEGQLSKMMADLEMYVKQAVTYAEVERQLKTQNEAYRLKYEEFHESLLHSSSVYENCREEMVKMSKRAKQTEKEMQAWKKKYESSNLAVLKFAQEKLDDEKSMKQLQLKNETLEKLCRALRSSDGPTANRSMTLNPGSDPGGSDTVGSATAEGVNAEKDLDKEADSSSEVVDPDDGRSVTGISKCNSSRDTYDGDEEQER